MTVRRVSVARLADGQQLDLVIHELDSGSEGPTLSLVGTIMGDQPSGVEIIRRVLALLETVPFRGRIRALPVANPAAFQAHTRNNPIDMNNLNRMFPGNSDGMLSQQLAHAIFQTMVPGADALIALHSGGASPTVDFAYAFNDLELAKSLGTELLLPNPRHGGTLGEEAERTGVRVAATELGGGRQDVEKFLSKGFRAVRNALIHLGMLEGELELPTRQFLAERFAVMRAHQGGLLLSNFDSTSLGAQVDKADELGKVVSPYDFEVLEVFGAPFERSILALTPQSVGEINAGDYAFMLADLASAVAI